jgi:3D (Asp-Asp-Asp) domain-containing protein
MPAHRLHRASALGSVLLLAASLVLTATQPANAGGHHGHKRHHHDPYVVASGLDNPRQLSFDGKDLYVAEGGTGGDLQCIPGPEAEQICLGYTGAITKISSKGQYRVIEGLPSGAAPDGSGAGGPSDVAVRNGGYAVLMGYGGDPADRDALAAQGGDFSDFALFGTLLTGSLGKKGTWGPFVLADVSAYEGKANPEPSDVDTNPVGLYAAEDSFVVADAGGNDILGVDYRGDISTLAVLDQVPVPPGSPVPNADPVPTSAVPGPDGAYYISQLTGFPFPPGASTIYRWTPDGTLTPYATGLTNVTDLGWYGDTLYAVQLSDEGLASSEDPEALPSGSLVRIEDGKAVTVADDLQAPYGLALKGGSAYVTTCSVCAGDGEVVKIPLRR